MLVPAVPCKDVVVAAALLLHSSRHLLLVSAVPHMGLLHFSLKIIAAAAAAATAAAAAAAVVGAAVPHHLLPVPVPEFHHGSLQLVQLLLTVVVPLHSNVVLVAPLPPKVQNRYRLSEKRAADKRAKRVEAIANNPAAPEREEGIERDRAVVSLAQRRRAHANVAEGAGRNIDSRGAMATRTPKKDAQVPVHDRIKEFPNQTFYMINTGKMGCRACFGKEVSLHSYRVKDHIKGKKHQKRVAIMLATDEEDKVSLLVVGTLRAFAKRSEEDGGSYGDTLSDKDKLTQIKAVKGCLAAAIPLNALGNPVFGAFLAHFNVNLPHSGHLAKHIPLILEEEQAKVRGEIGDRPYALCFDATPYLCECFGVGVRFIGSSGQVAQRVLRLSMLKKSMTASDIAGEVNRIVTHEYGLDPDKCRAIMGDSCAANLLAMDALAKLFRYAIVIGCLSHTFNNIGKQLSSLDLDAFLGKMHTLLSHSAGAKALFKEKVGVRAPSTPGHRWGSRFDRDYVIAMNWPGVLEFIAAYESGDTDKSKAAKFMRDELVRVRDDNKTQSLHLQMQLALMVDVGRSAHKTYNIVERFRSKLELAEDGVFSNDVSLPTVSALLAKYIGQGDDLDALDPLRQYAHDKIGRHSQARDAKTLEVFKAAKLTDFTFMKGRKYSDDTIRTLKVLPFVKKKMVRGLLKEKEDFYMAASDTEAEYGHMAFWNDNKKKLPTWHALVLDVALLQPSSAFMERVFSILRCCFNERQEHVYSDRICASVLLKYNRGRAQSSSAEMGGGAEDANNGGGSDEESDDSSDEDSD
ncbi:unnamed protein product [Ectocarpus sp. CCAP 1310/34]|nr:unnamed protein product [Ectocarpus sp. CCAP 1310/34]